MTPPFYLYSFSSSDSSGFFTFSLHLDFSVARPVDDSLTFVPLKGKRCVFAWSNFHLEVEKRICLVEFSIS